MARYLISLMSGTRYLFRYVVLNLQLTWTCFLNCTNKSYYAYPCGISIQSAVNPATDHEQQKTQLFAIWSASLTQMYYQLQFTYMRVVKRRHIPGCLLSLNEQGFSDLLHPLVLLPICSAAILAAIV
jgi:hypothetical protein